MNNETQVEKLSTDVKKFVVWLSYSNWWYDSTRDLWTMDGYKNRTTDELFEYFLKTRNYGKQ